jgi:peptidyl-tRNA hydrolase
MAVLDVIWIETAAKQYGRSRTWLDEQVKAGKLHVFKREGDKKVYLSVAELEHLLALKKVDRQEDAG